MTDRKKMEQPTLYVFFGLIASGKSTLAELFAAQQGLPYYNTDRVRKELAGLAANERRPDGMGQGIYTPEFTEKTYQTMLDRANEDLQQGKTGVVLDGSYSKATDRHKVNELAQTLQVNALFFLCSCSEQETQRRLALRAQDPNAVSDGRWEIFVQQRAKFEQPDELPLQQLSRIDTEADPQELLGLLTS
ncbi:MAG: AAA family ATPase [Candidatus Electrothrix aestuarii]|uniref:AAA family ATPase n=1 Tax=Candidatus Electrothrix aestuarii TaxID=3062594 RepID=A0AAU8LZC0_9BACT